MKKKICLTALCLLVVASGCAQKQEGTEFRSTQETAGEENVSSAKSDDLYTFSAETSQGLYNTALPGVGNKLRFLDYATGENRFLCTEPGCTHADDRCPARLPEGNICSGLYPLADGSLTYQISEGDQTSFWRMDSDGKKQRELACLADDGGIWNFLGADKEFLYLGKETYEAAAAFTVSRLPLAGGTPETLWSREGYVDSDQLLGVTGRNLVLWRWDWSEQKKVPEPELTEDMPKEEVRQKQAEYNAEMAKVTGKFCVLFCSIDTGEEFVLDSWTATYGSSARTLFWDRDRLYWFDCEELGPLHWITADGKNGEMSVQWPQDLTQWEGKLNVNLEQRMVGGKMLLTVCEFREADPVIRRYALDLDSGIIKEIPLQYISNATECPISILGQGEEELLVIFEEQMRQSTYLDADGLPATTLEPHLRMGMIRQEDFLAGTPNYREIPVDMP